MRLTSKGSWDMEDTSQGVIPAETACPCQKVYQVRVESTLRCEVELGYDVDMS